MKKKLLLCALETVYAKRLADYIRRSESNCFEIAIYSSWDILCENEKNKLINLILIEDSAYEEVCRNRGVTSLTDGECVDGVRVENYRILVREKPGESDDIRYVYRYMPANDIYMALLSAVIEEAILVSDYESEAECRIIGIFSPVKRAFKTTYSVVLSQLLGERGDTLYINLEGISGLRSQMYCNLSSTFTDLLYKFSVNRKLFPMLLNQYVVKQGDFDMIVPCESIEELQEIERKDLCELLRYIAGAGGYKYMVLDVGDYLNGIMDVLKMCTKIHMPIRSDAISKAKVSEFMDSIAKSGTNNVIADRIRLLNIPFFADAEGGIDIKVPRGLTDYVLRQIDGEVKSDVRWE